MNPWRTFQVAYLMTSHYLDNGSIKKTKKKKNHCIQIMCATKDNIRNFNGNQQDKF